jgi:2-polyprenyl-3-methyl-5-hydroxy-6-metoxy-1,4-benzoquinol methylase
MQEVLTQCPVCSGSDFSTFLEGKDYFLSNESFVIQSCKECGFKFTNPRPDSNSIISYYDSEKYISHNAKNGGLTTTIYRLARYFSIRNKYAIIKSHSPGKRILDIGCGTAELLNYCQKKRMEVHGVEPNEKAREFAKTKYSLNIVGNLNELKEKGEKFDCICLWHVLEHLPSLTQSLEDISCLLQIEGIIIIAVPNSESWDAKHYKKFWAAYDLPRHLYHFSEKSIIRLLKNHALGIIKTIPQKLDAFYISLLSERYKSGHGNFFMALLQGIISNFRAWEKRDAYSSTIFVIKMENI